MPVGYHAGCPVLARRLVHRVRCCSCSWYTYLQKDQKEVERAVWPKLYTMQQTYQDIAGGMRPWTALGDFMNYFFGYTPDQRTELVDAAIQEPEHPSAEQHRWAVFCAAAVEYLCSTYDIACPAWVNDAPYGPLPDPWFEALGAEKPQVQARLRRETPEPFARRNIFCGNRVFANKYELAKQVHQRRSASVLPITQPH